jgi:hypothetical protein
MTRLHTSSDVIASDEAYALKIARRREIAVGIAAIVFAAFAVSPLLYFPWQWRGAFLWGVLIGSLAELLIILASRWAWDRVQWLRWFSR